MPGTTYSLLAIDDEALALKLFKRVFEPESDIKLHAARGRIGVLNR